MLKQFLDGFFALGVQEPSAGARKMFLAYFGGFFLPFVFFPANPFALFLLQSKQGFIAYLG